MKIWTVNKIGDEGASNISESLKINTTLNKLILDGNIIQHFRVCVLGKKWTVNEIGAEGRSKKSESLMINTTLTQLNELY